ncbi:hypothetical protein BBP40_000576 [Aspergillus hancockii]|nr:hypothetical protein BBP40_000576 [Aspergillus hancockii]
MAPRRGGSSSYGASYGSSSSNSCRSGAFATKESIVLITFHALFFLVFLALSGIAAFQLFRSKQKGTALKRWFALGFSIVFSIIAVILNIISYVLLQCDIVSPRGYQVINIPLNWFGMVGNFLLVALIMIPLCKRLVEGNSKIARMVTIAHSAYVALLAILLLCTLAIYTRVINARYSSSYRASDVFLPLHYQRLKTAYCVLAVIGMLLAAASMLFALARGRHLRKGILLAAIPLLIVSSLGMTVLDLANHIIIAYRQEEYLRKGVNAFNRSLEAQLFLAYFFYATAFLMALIVASSRKLAVNRSSAPVTHFHQQPKYSGVPVQPVYPQPPAQERY